VLVANDEVAEDPVQQNLMEMVLAEGIAVRFWSLQKVIDNIHRALPTARKFCWSVNHPPIF
jgi:PTS system N-acetylgalactosamine-specific IIB component